jgi:serine-type D-Ala-D-Ala carboxypeptidase/endopeptidase
MATNLEEDAMSVIRTSRRFSCPGLCRKQGEWVLTTAFCLAILLTPGVIPADGAGASEPIPEKVKKNVRQRVNNGWTVGMIVGVVDSEGASYYAFGSPAEDSKDKITKDTVFEIGSISKVFTSILLAQMVEDGNVSLDDPIDAFLPEGVKAPAFKGDKITLRSLAMHKSGLPRIPDNMAPSDTGDPYADYRDKQLYAFLNDFVPERAMGAKYEYSNLGAGLLGHLLSRRGEQSYEKLVISRICKPLEMNDTCITLSAEQRARFAKGYADDQQTSPWTFDCLAGCGAIRSTAADMVKFLEANMGLRKTALAPALRRTCDHFEETGEKDLRIGLGWHVFNKYGSDIIWHNGGTGGFRSWCGFRPDTKVGVVVLSNSSHSVDEIGLHILEPQYKLAKVRKLIALEEGVLDSYSGYYELKPGVVLHITRDGARLFAQMTGQNRLRIFPESETEFFYRAIDARITFTKKKGTVRRLVLHQNGMDQTAERLPPDWQPPPPRKEMTVATSVLSNYAGQYELAPNVIFDVTATDGKLFVKLTGQMRLRVYAESETEFFYKEVDAQITFVRDESGKCKSLILHQSGKDLEAKRIEKAE